MKDSRPDLYYMWLFNRIPVSICLCFMQVFFLSICKYFINFCTTLCSLNGSAWTDFFRSRKGMCNARTLEQMFKENN
jgi:hypothetical protein